MEHESKVAPKSDVTSPAGMGPTKNLAVLGGMPKQLEPKAIMEVNMPLSNKGKGEKPDIGIM